MKLERELLSLEKKNLESGEEEDNLREQSVIGDDGSNKNLGATSIEGTGTESNQEIDLGSLKDFEGVTELGRLLRGLEAVQETKPVIKELSDIETSFVAREEGLDPSVLQLISVPITDPV